VFLFSFFSCCIKSGHQPQEDLARSGYKINKVLGTLLYVGEPLRNLLTKYGDFKRKKLEICPNPPKKSWLFHNSLLPLNVRILKEILQNVHLIMLLGALFFLIAKMANLGHRKITTSSSNNPDYIS
jgi:hypothetical protein